MKFYEIYFISRVKNRTQPKIFLSAGNRSGFLHDIILQH
jgi:hypothetical protein